MIGKQQIALVSYIIETSHPLHFDDVLSTKNYEKWCSFVEMHAETTREEE